MCNIFCTKLFFCPPQLVVRRFYPLGSAIRKFESLDVIRFAPWLLCRPQNGPAASQQKQMTASWFASRVDPTEYKLVVRVTHTDAGSPSGYECYVVQQ